MIRNSLTYLTRRCPRKCGYCALRDSKDVGPELSLSDWDRVFSILSEMEVDFNLILGNETWIRGDDIPLLFQSNKVPYALYTTCPPFLFDRYREKLIGSGIIDNLSCGVDYPMDVPDVDYDDDSYKKSVSAWGAFQWVKRHYPEVDCQGTVTVHRRNFRFLPQIVKELSSLGVFIGINFIHWDKDGGFDFFPSASEISPLLFRKEDFAELRHILDLVLDSPGLLQNPEMLKEPVALLAGMGWHCHGNPYGGPTIDSDGSLRVCGYRKGKRTSKFSIFDLPTKLDEWRWSVEKDAQECPGCFWSYPWMFHYWNREDVSFGKAVFIQHAGRKIHKDKWSNRRIGRERR